jgi:hypothetical protein
MSVTQPSGDPGALQQEEFERLRRRLQLTNLRIARLYILLKGSKGRSDENDRDVLEELWVTDQEFQQHLSALSGVPATHLEDPDAAESLSALDRSAAVLARRLQAEDLAAARRGRSSRFDSLCTRCNLNDIDREILLIALGPEIDRRYRRVFAYLHDDFTRGIPSVGLVVDILAPLLGRADRLSLLGRFEAESPLLKRGLLDLMPARSDDTKPLSQRHLRVTEAAAGWLLGVPRMADSVADRARFLGVPEAPRLVSLPRGGPDMLAAVAARIRGAAVGVSVFISSKDVPAARAAADQLCAVLESPVVRVELGAFLGTAERLLEDLTQVLQDAHLFSAALQVLSFPEVDLEEPASLRSLEVAWRCVQGYPGLIIVPAKAQPPAAWSVEGRHTIPIAIEMPGFGERIWVLRELVGQGAEAPDDDDLRTLANRYRMSRLQLQQTVSFARDKAWARGEAGEETRLQFDDLVSGARAQFARDIGSLATRHTPRFGLEELVLPEREKAHLSELLAFVERRGTVYEDWGFRQKFTRGTGAKALFFGRSGTGKTMAAEVIAKHLSLDLFKVDLSSIVSKWVGETEKNLATIFDRAEEAQAVLLFDEADSLFGQRTSVGSAVDRYANLETNYLLQRIEEYDGVAILSSNFKQNIDEAFTRRFHFVLEFPFPDRDSREEIWVRAFPEQAPLADDVDFQFLADRFKFTGGNIKNTILRAAFLGASEDAKAIGMRHLLRAVVREYQNLEREPMRREFGEWWGDVKDMMDLEKGRRRRDERA